MADSINSGRRIPKGVHDITDSVSGKPSTPDKLINRVIPSTVTPPDSFRYAPNVPSIDGEIGTQGNPWNQVASGVAEGSLWIAEDAIKQNKDPKEEHDRFLGELKHLEDLLG